jgi:hypothetical protein
MSTTQEKKIETLCQEIVQLKGIMSRDLENWDPKTRGGQEILKRESQDKLEKLGLEYAEYLKRSAVSVVLTGAPEDVQEFVTIARQESAEAPVVLDAQELYRRLAEEASPGIGPSRYFGVSAVGLVIQGLAAIGKDLGISYVDAPVFTYDVLVPDEAAVINVIRDGIRATTGNDLQRLYLRLKTYEQALAIGYSTSLIPVFITGGHSSEQETLLKLFGAGLQVAVKPESKEGEEAHVSKAFVIKTFKDIVKTAKERRPQ